ncbi:hypothetical protein CEXT_724191 [Caerostris extrusa]|uniref:Uncharacterized protein n=1 Tax=Caerostris extrusa TaxID=172846 RepID=A0AAV4PB03_CAEEX|nr:hypothetical protein CEXT_724191 [Caerostris extrusa]
MNLKAEPLCFSEIRALCLSIGWFHFGTTDCSPEKSSISNAGIPFLLFKAFEITLSKNFEKPSLPFQAQQDQPTQTRDILAKDTREESTRQWSIG